MSPEYSRQERFTDYAHTLYERFQSGVLTELQPLRQWVVWRAELEDGKHKKVPYNPHYRMARASVKIPKSWASLPEALTALESGNFSGLGFMLAPPLVMVDLDKSFDKATHTITDPLAEEIVSLLNSYTEVSPRNGLHILAYGQLPGAGIHSAIEMYGQDRFTTITTNHLSETLPTIEQRQDALAALYTRFAPAAAEKGSQNTVLGGVAPRLAALPPEAASDRLLQALLSGDMSSVGNDHHRADWILLMKLLHWTGDDIALAKQLFLASPLGQREKAQDTEGKGRRGSTTYVDRTIERIVANRRNPPQKR